MHSYCKTPSRVILLVFLCTLVCQVSWAQSQAQVSHASVQSLQGAWTGTLEQENNPTRYTFSLLVESVGREINGTSRLDTMDKQYYGVMSFSAKLDDRTLHYQETGITEQSPLNGTYWCIKKGDLKLSANGNELSGKWDDPGCNVGTVRLKRSPSLTIYVDEGRWLTPPTNGHVFIELRDQAIDDYRGWYPGQKKLWIFKPVGLAGGEIRNDAKTAADGHWDVKKTYSITESQLHLALTAETRWASLGLAWSISNHCGDFAITIAHFAGVEIAPFAGWDRPGRFGSYLRSHGGVVNPDRH